MKRLRNYFISGLLFWIPLALSVLVIKFFLEVVNNFVPARFLPETLLNLDTSIPGSGIIPGFRSIYNVLKKVSTTVLNASSDSFRKAFLVQYPSKGIWVIAFQSGDYKGEAESLIGEEILNLFVPTTPNPTSGFFIMVSKNDVLELDMSVEEAFKLVISAGVVTPNTLNIKEDK